jgi:4-carboxymuconolactone decarboxylase
MVQLASMIACQALSEYRVMLGAALTVGVTPIEVKEIVYQAVPYVGLAKVFDFIHTTNDVLTDRGIQLPLEGQSATTPETREERGVAVQKEIVGADVVDQMYAAASDDEVHFQHLLSANCFGDHYTRSGIDVRNGNFSPSPCSSRSVGASPKLRATLLPTSTSATAVPCFLASSHSCCPSSAIPAR